MVIGLALRGAGAVAKHLLKKKAKKTFEGELRKKLLKKKAKEGLEATTVGAVIGGAPILAAGLAQYDSRKEKRKKQKKQRTESRKKQRGMSSGGSVKLAKKYFKGGIV